MATFRRPHMKYTDMAIYIDHHIYTDDCDQVKVYEYLYHLIQMLARQGSYFHSASDYDDFSMSGASRVFLRLTNPKQFELDEEGKPKLEPIVSVLNYLKSIIYPMKVNYEQQFYKQTTAYNKASEAFTYEFETSFQKQLEEDIDGLRLSDFDIYLSEMDRTCRAFIHKIPMSKNSFEWGNIYFSVLLSLLNSVTLCNKNKKVLKTLEPVLLEKPELIDKLYKQERKDSLILYHLDESYRNYVQVLVNRLRHVISRDVSSKVKINIPSQINAQNLLLSSIDDDEE